MPFPTEHSARIHSPSEFKSFARKSFAPDIDIILGIKKGVSTIQAYRFKKDKFSVAQAKQWLKDNNIKFMSFEPAEGAKDCDKSIKAKAADMSLKIELPEAREHTPEGYLIAPARFMKPGILEYHGFEIKEVPDLQPMGIYKIFQDASVLFSPETIQSFENKPFVNNHPGNDVTADNSKNLVVGFVRDVHRDNQDYLAGMLIVTDANTIKEIEGGKIELSAGYDYTIIPRETIESDTIPKDVDFVRTRITGNHVALVDKGRAGHECKIGDKGGITMDADLEKLLTGISTKLDQLMEMEKAEAEGEKNEEADGEDKAADKGCKDCKDKDTMIAAHKQTIAELMAAKEKSKGGDDEAMDKKAEDRAMVIESAKRLNPSIETKGKSLKSIMIETLKSCYQDAAEVIDPILGGKDMLAQDSTGEEIIHKAFDVVCALAKEENSFGKSFVKEQKGHDSAEKPEDYGKKLAEMHNVFKKK